MSVSLWNAVSLKKNDRPVGFRHTVLWTFREHVSDAVRDAMIASMSQVFDASEVLGYYVNRSRESRSVHKFEWELIVDFENESAAARYFNSEARTAFIRAAWMPVVQEHVVLDGTGRLKNIADLTGVGFRHNILYNFKVGTPISEQRRINRIVADFLEDMPPQKTWFQLHNRRSQDDGGLYDWQVMVDFQDRETSTKFFSTPEHDVVRAAFVPLLSDLIVLDSYEG